MKTIFLYACSLMWLLLGIFFHVLALATKPKKHSNKHMNDSEEKLRARCWHVDFRSDSKGKCVLDGDLGDLDYDQPNGIRPF